MRGPSKRATPILAVLAIAAGVAWSGCGSDTVDSVKDEANEALEEGREKLDNATKEGEKALEDARNKGNKAIGDAERDLKGSGY